jgi:arginine exporter protein ArgO
MQPIWLSLAFMIVNVVVLWVILKLNQRPPAPGPKPPGDAAPAQEAPQARKELLEASEILGWEFQYAQATASEAMEQRHTLANLYLLITGAAVSAVAAILGGDPARLRVPGVVLLWVLCGIGWLYFLAIIRLRQAWHDSARAMNQIKEFYIQHAGGFEPDLLRTAFRWQANSLPRPEKAWTVFFYSAMLISFIDSVAYVGGSVLLGLDATLALPLANAVILVMFGLVFFAFHVWLYFAFLRPRP